MEIPSDILEDLKKINLKNFETSSINLENSSLLSSSWRDIFCFFVFGSS
jgi:predicted nucleotidyltransferase